MNIEPMPPGDTYRPLKNWIRQTALFVQMIRARDLRKGVPDAVVPEAFTFAEEVYGKVYAKVGPPEKYANVQTWLTAMSDETLRWANEHLDR